MEPMDQKNARQVWKRVTAAPTPTISPGDLHSLVVSANEIALLYRSLAASLSGKPREAALGLSAGQEATVFALRGMQKLSFGRGEAPKPGPAPQKNTRGILEHCYRGASNALREYTARSIGAEYGPVFRQLAAREENNCLQILTLLGQI